MEIMEPVKAAMIITPEVAIDRFPEKKDHRQCHDQFCTGRDSQAQKVPRSGCPKKV